MKKLTGMYFRWLSEIQSYDFIVRHRPGKQNSNADGMSRSSHLDPPTKEEEEEEVELTYSIQKKTQCVGDIAVDLLI